MTNLLTKPLYIYSYCFTIAHIVDFIVIGFFLYRSYTLIKGSTAVNILTGLLIVYGTYFVVQSLNLKLCTIILKKITIIGPIIPIILFQREIRNFLSTIGSGILSGKNILESLIPWLAKNKEEIDVTPIVKAAQALGGSNTGALIVLTKNEDLRYYETSGDLVNAMVSARLLMAIFNKYSPLHDGAVIIYKNKIVAARCVLPITDNPNLPAHFGLRHKAAIGLTEITDTLVIVVSEESGQMSIARQGQIASNLSAQEIRSMIKTYLT